MQIPSQIKVSGRALGFGLLLIGCAADEKVIDTTAILAANASAALYESPGPHPVANYTFSVSDTVRGRALDVEVWVPADASVAAAAAKGEPTANFVTSETRRAIWNALVAKPLAKATSRQTHSARDGKPAGGTFPLVVFSHCYNGSRFSMFSIAERLASHGIAVAAPDHAGGTLFDEEEGHAASLGPEFLDVRQGDIRFVLDVLLGGGAPVPAALHGKFNAKQVGVFGHSFGGVTAGRVLNLDKRSKAGLALAVPMENPLLPGVDLKNIHVPLAFIVAQEDHSIREIGNKFIRDNFAKANAPVFKIEVRDAGHFSFTDICGIVESFDAGCAVGTVARDTDASQRFTYLEIETARGIAQAYVTAFFSAQLKDDPAGLVYLKLTRPNDLVEVDSRQ